MTDQERVQELLTRSRLPDPCTLVFSVPKEAPPSVNEEGRTWSVEQWIGEQVRVEFLGEGLPIEVGHLVAVGSDPGWLVLRIAPDDAEVLYYTTAIKSVMLARGERL